MIEWRFLTDNKISKKMEIHENQREVKEHSRKAKKKQKKILTKVKFIFIIWSQNIIILEDMKGEWLKTTH